MFSKTAPEVLPEEYVVRLRQRLASAMLSDSEAIADLMCEPPMGTHINRPVHRKTSDYQTINLDWEI